MKLVIEDEAGTRSIVPFAAGELLVGRAAEGTGFRLLERNVSRRHARFLNVNGVVSVEDLGSLTGTRVNGDRISGRRRLREGDLIEIGDYDLAVVADDGLAAVAGPGAPPPLPGPARPPPAIQAPPAPAAAPERPGPAPTSTPSATASAAASTSGARTPRLGFLLACLAALALGGAAGYAVGAATASPAATGQGQDTEARK